MVDERDRPADGARTTPSGGIPRQVVRHEPQPVPHRSSTDRREHLVVTGADAARVADIGLAVARELGRPFVDGDGLVQYHRLEQHDVEGDAIEVLERVLGRRDTVVVSMSTVLLDLVEHARTWSVLVDAADAAPDDAARCAISVDEADAGEAAAHIVESWRCHVGSSA
jgi:hypothetical protein